MEDASLDWDPRDREFGLGGKWLQEREGQKALDWAQGLFIWVHGNHSVCGVNGVV